MRTKINYAEGDYFTIPLRDRGFARGVIARMNGKGGIFGYFFAPRLSSEDEASDTSELTPESAILLRDCGDLGLLNGEWTNLGRIANWNRQDWTMPPLVRIDEIEGKAWVSHYDDVTFEFISEEPIDPALASQYPRDVTAGYGAIEIVLTELLS